MPELPEVETTVRGLNENVKNLVIKDVWTDYFSEFHIGKPNIKNRTYFKKFHEAVSGARILGAARRAKNVLIHLSNGKTILVHMKMTGHLLYGEYEKIDKNWKPKEEGPLKDPFNRFIHVVFTLGNGKHLVLSDLRKFAKITLIDTKNLEKDPDLSDLGPEPLSENFSEKIFTERLSLRPKGKIKQVLMDQTVIAGIGNIYSDEILFAAGVHPLTEVTSIPKKNLRLAYQAMKKILRYSLAIGGSSESDYRNIFGQPGNFQNKTKAYGHEGERCSKRGCGGKIVRIKIGGRSASFCPKHQPLVK
jgi:formamidopyrimidine-DNA glycosylase